MEYCSAGSGQLRPSGVALRNQRDLHSNLRVTGVFTKTCVNEVSSPVCLPDGHGTTVSFAVGYGSTANYVFESVKTGVLATECGTMFYQGVLAVGHGPKVAQTTPQITAVCVSYKQLTAGRHEYPLNKELVMKAFRI